MPQINVIAAFLGLLVLSVTVSRLGAQPRTAVLDFCVPAGANGAPKLPARLMDGQGRVHMKITTRSADAQRYFDQAVAQMHSFWLVESERSFRQAAALDPAAPMPWWGVAMVASGDYRPRFQVERLAENYGIDPARTTNWRSIDAARRAVSLARQPGMASAVERAYIDTMVARRLLNDGNPQLSYVSSLRRLIAHYPAEVEARLYLALELMRGYTLPDHIPQAESMEAVKLLRQLQVEAPDHPGVHHYFIHALESSSFAEDALPSCQRYSEIVTGIPHAIHMPGHIYSQTGRLESAIAAFTNAALVETSYLAANPGESSSHYGHNLRYLSIAYTLAGKTQQAKETARRLLAIPETAGERAQAANDLTAFRQGWFGLLSALVDSSSWNEILDGTSLLAYDRPKEIAWRHWARAIAFAGRRKLEEATHEAHSFEVALSSYSVQIRRDVPAELRVAQLELNAQLLAAKGDTARALAAFEAASQGQRQLRYSEPPRYPRSISNVLGDYCLSIGKLDLAEKAFRTSLQDVPGNARSVAGLAKAQRLSKAGL